MNCLAANDMAGDDDDDYGDDDDDYGDDDANITNNSRHNNSRPTSSFRTFST